MDDGATKKRPIKVKVSDRRRREREPVKKPASAPADGDNPEEASEPVAETVERAEAERDYLDDLKRLQAEFDNYRKRVLREQTQLAQRASARLIERVLPVLDNFQSAIDHGAGGSGIELVHRELQRVLEEEGLEEIKAEKAPFDPNLHEAFEAHEDQSVEEPTVQSVLRRGYLLKGRVLRPAMVSVARPPDAESDESEETTEKDAAEG